MDNQEQDTKIEERKIMNPVFGILRVAVSCFIFIFNGSVMGFWLSTPPVTQASTVRSAGSLAWHFLSGRGRNRNRGRGSGPRRTTPCFHPYGIPYVA